MPVTILDIEIKAAMRANYLFLEAQDLVTIHYSLSMY